MSDLFFQSRRAPAAGGLYAMLTVCAVVMVFALGGTTTEVGWTDPAKETVLQKGDRIVAIAGVENPKSWDEIATAVKCIPATCVAPKALGESAPPSHWDPRACSCTTRAPTGAPTVSAVRIVEQETSTVVRAETSGVTGDDFALFALTDPPRLVIDVTGSRMGAVGGPFHVANGTISEVSASYFEDEGAGVTRIVVGLTAPLPEERIATLDGSSIVVEIPRHGAVPSRMELGTPKPTPGVIPATIVRNGETMNVELKDSKATMTAADRRKLAAGPGLTLTPWALGLLGFVMSLCVIGTHGLLSGTATMDFGGRKGAATAVGIIDGFVYLGSGVQAFALGMLTTKSWSYWPMFLIPFSLLGFVLCLPIWNSKPKGRGGH